MTTRTAQIEQGTRIEAQESAGFETGQVMTIVGGHFIHDVYTAFVAPLLPLLIERLSLSLTMAGSLTAIQQVPALLNPFIGYLADRVSLRYFVILAPGISATLIGLLGLAPSYFALAVILFTVGISSAAFHAPAPAMIGRISSGKVGLGMSLFMAGGELARAAGPLLAVWAVSTWTLEGIYRIAALGWASSLILFWRLRGISARTSRPNSLESLRPALKTLFLPLFFVNFFRMFMMVALSIFLPTFMNLEGASLWLAGGALSILELAGVAGALLSGTMSDKIGRKPILLVATVGASIFMLLFLNTSGWLLVPVLLGLGFSTLSTSPVMMAMVQDHLPDHRAVGNGLYMALNFVLRTVDLLAVGAVGDALGLRTAYLWSAVIALLAVPAILTLPKDASTPVSPDQPV